jgi:hypothetical protein
MERADNEGRIREKEVVNKCEIVEMRTVSRQYLTVLRRRRRRRLSDGDDASESKWKEGRKEGDEQEVEC